MGKFEGRFPAFGRLKIPDHTICCFSLPTALPTAYSCASAVALAALTFAAMQVFKDKLALEGIMTILGGFIGSWFFIFILTVSHRAATYFGSGC